MKTVFVSLLSLIGITACASNYTDLTVNEFEKTAYNGTPAIIDVRTPEEYAAGHLRDAAIEDVDIAFLPVNQPYTMTVEQCVKAAKVLRPRVLIPYHFSTTDLSSLPEQLPGIEVLLRQMQ